MKSFLKYCTIALLAVLMVSGGCKRKSDDAVTPSTTDSEQTQQTTASSDESTAQSELDDAISSVDDYINSQNTSLLRQGAPIAASPFAWNCGGNISVDTSLAGQKQYTLTFNNSVCNGRTRNGSITFRLISGNRWVDQGAVLRVSFSNYSVSRLVNGTTKTVTFNNNSYHDVTNVSGGRIIEATANRSIVHKVRGRMIVSFDNGSTRSWSVYRRRTFTSGNNGLTVKISGDTTIGSKTNVDCIGVTRYDDTFMTRITTPIESNAQCGFWKPVAGQKVNEINLRSLTVTFGLNSNGQAVASGSCATHYRIQTGVGNSVTFNVLIPY